MGCQSTSLKSGFAQLISSPVWNFHPVSNKIPSDGILPRKKTSLGKFCEKEKDERKKAHRNKQQLFMNLRL